MKKSLREEAETLAKRPYRVKVIPDETTEGSPAFLAQVLELDNCVGQGSSVQEAIADVKNAMVDYIESLLEDSLPVPEPIALLPVSISSGFPLSLAVDPASRPLVPPSQEDLPRDLQETVRPEYIHPAMHPAMA